MAIINSVRNAPSLPEEDKAIFARINPIIEKHSMIALHSFSSLQWELASDGAGERRYKLILNSNSLVVLEKSISYLAQVDERTLVMEMASKKLD